MNGRSTNEHHTEVDTSAVYFIHSGSSYSCAQFGVNHERRASYEYKHTMIVIPSRLTYEEGFPCCFRFRVHRAGKSPLGPRDSEENLAVRAISSVEKQVKYKVWPVEI